MATEKQINWLIGATNPHDKRYAYIYRYTYGFIASDGHRVHHIRSPFIDETDIPAPYEPPSKHETPLIADFASIQHKINWNGETVMPRSSVVMVENETMACARIGNHFVKWGHWSDAISIADAPGTEYTECCGSPLLVSELDPNPQLWAGGDVRKIVLRLQISIYYTAYLLTVNMQEAQ